MNRRIILGTIMAFFVTPVISNECDVPYNPSDNYTPDDMSNPNKYIDALERITQLDEADGHELKVKHAFEAVAIASITLGKHPSQVFSDRWDRHLKAIGKKTSK